MSCARRQGRWRGSQASSKPPRKASRSRCTSQKSEKVKCPAPVSWPSPTTLAPAGSASNGASCCESNGVVSSIEPPRMSVGTVMVAKKSGGNGAAGACGRMARTRGSVNVPSGLVPPASAKTV